MVCRPYSAQGVVRGLVCSGSRVGCRDLSSAFLIEGVSLKVQRQQGHSGIQCWFSIVPTACESPQLYINGQLSLGNSDELLILSVVLFCIFLLPGRWAH